MDSGALNLVALLLSVLAIILTTVPAFQQTRLQVNSNVLPITIDMFREWRSSEFKQSQDYILTELARIPPDRGFDLPEETKVHVVRVSHYLDNLGLLVSFGVVREDLILAFIGGSIKTCWDALEPYIKAERERRNAGYYQEYFEHLTARAIAFNDHKTYGRIQRVANTRSRFLPGGRSPSDQHQP